MGPSTYCRRQACGVRSDDCTSCALRSRHPSGGQHVAMSLGRLSHEAGQAVTVRMASQRCDHAVVVGERRTAWPASANGQAAIAVVGVLMMSVWPSARANPAPLTTRHRRSGRRSLWGRWRAPPSRLEPSTNRKNLTLPFAARGTSMACGSSRPGGWSGASWADRGRRP
jgi:hypothetical protein